MIDMALHRDYPEGNVLNCDNRPYSPEKVKITDIVWNNYDWLDSLNKAGYLRKAIMENIDKTLLCNTIYLGYDAFECPNCHNGNLLYRHCHSRFCNSCGVKEQKMVAARVSETAIDASHRHIVFTIPEELRNYFRIDRKALDLLFIAARNTICCIFNEKIYRKAKKKYIQDSYYLYRHFRHKKEFGMIACLHTFGRDLKWNPHIHALVPEMIYDPENNTIKPFSHFDFKKLRLTFQYELLRLMTEYFGDRFKQTKNNIYRDHGKGFYVYAKYNSYDLSETEGKKIDHIKGVKQKVNYIMRYASRPAMAESRIVSYDKNTNTVHWFYNRHEDDMRVDVIESAHDFIKHLIVHIPDDEFRMIRYYGFYDNRKRSSLDRIYKLLAQKKQKEYISVKRRVQLAKIHSRRYHIRTFIMDSYNRDIMRCSCGAIMVYVDSYDPLKGVKDHERYRKECIDEMREMRSRRGSPRMDPAGA
jgi:hypothetical protein